MTIYSCVAPASTRTTTATGHMAPDQEWFSNMRVVNPTKLEKFYKEMNKKGVGSVLRRVETSQTAHRVHITSSSGDAHVVHNLL